MNGFTFQYGSIKSAAYAGLRHGEIFFTFQYGSIKSIRICPFTHRLYWLYIPVWFY